MQILNFIEAFWFWIKLTLLYSAKCMDSFVALNCVQTTSHWLVTRHWQWYCERPATTSGNPVIELHLLHLHSICKLHNVNLVLCNLNDHSVSASKHVCILLSKYKMCVCFDIVNFDAQVNLSVLSVTIITPGEWFFHVMRRLQCPLMFSLSVRHCH